MKTTILAICITAAYGGITALFWRIYRPRLPKAFRPGHPEEQALKGGLRVHWEPIYDELAVVQDALAEEEAWLESQGITRAQLEAHEAELNRQLEEHYASLPSPWDNVPDVIAADCAEAACNPVRESFTTCMHRETSARTFYESREQIPFEWEIIDTGLTWEEAHDWFNAP